jgi:CHAT domain-containing protein
MAYLPCASLSKYLKQKDTGARAAKLLAIVDPDTDYNGDGKPDLPALPYAREEVLGFAPRFQEKQILAGAAAVKADCLRFAPQFDVLHIACHGEFYPARPWDSALFLAGAGKTRADPGQKADPIDGRLRASEVYSMDLRRSRLVALSGCETGRSQVFPGDDAVSLATAFLHSGASSLLVSLWKVEDQATAALMKSFYRKWIQEGKDKARALRESKLELLEGSFSRPRQWAAFVLIGQP